MCILCLLFTVACTLVCLVVLCLVVLWALDGGLAWCQCMGMLGSVCIHHGDVGPAGPEEVSHDLSAKCACVHLVVQVVHRHTVTILVKEHSDS